MEYNRLFTVAVRTIILMAGTVCITIGILETNVLMIITGVLMYIACLIIYRTANSRLKEKSWLMLEAIKNRDYSFRLPSYGCSGSEHILQDTLNKFGDMMGEQKQLMEQREKFYELILSNITSGIVVLDNEMRVLQTNPAAPQLLGLPVLSTLTQLDRFSNGLSDTLKNLHAGEKCNIQYSTNKKEVQISVRASSIDLGSQKVKILAINDIRSELDAKELDSWVKLTRVLTHEIMNSIAPISSLSETFMNRKDVIESPIYEGIKAIHDTSCGLISFVDSYRKFSSLQKPSPEPFYLKDLMTQISELHIIPAGIKFSQLIEPDNLMLYADTNLMRQVFINIIKNAVQAIGDNEGRIHLKAYTTADDHIFIYISNDGPVIPENVAEEIFVPFFTTKNNGSGIGLSLSRQILKLSGGSISLLKAGSNGWNTTFVIEFE